jgi:hypothetical protein
MTASIQSLVPSQPVVHKRIGHETRLAEHQRQL